MEYVCLKKRCHVTVVVVAVAGAVAGAADAGAADADVAVAVAAAAVAAAAAAAVYRYCSATMLTHSYHPIQERRGRRYADLIFEGMPHNSQN